MSAIKRVDCTYHIAIVENIGLSEPLLLCPWFAARSLQFNFVQRAQHESQKEGIHMATFRPKLLFQELVALYFACYFAHSFVS